MTPRKTRSQRRRRTVDGKAFASVLRHQALLGADTRLQRLRDWVSAAATLKDEEKLGSKGPRLRYVSPGEDGEHGEGQASISTRVPGSWPLDLFARFCVRYPGYEGTVECFLETCALMNWKMPHYIHPFLWDDFIRYRGRRFQPKPEHNTLETMGRVWDCLLLFKPYYETVSVPQFIGNVVNIETLPEYTMVDHDLAERIRIALYDSIPLVHRRMVSEALQLALQRTITEDMAGSQMGG